MPYEGAVSGCGDLGAEVDGDLGDQGAGKTTLLRALINSIPLNERFGTLRPITS